MTRSSLCLLALTAALALGPVAASAQDAAPPAPEAQPAGAVVRAFGLVGRWASDCAKPASPENAYAIYAAGYSGDASLSYNIGVRYEPRVYELSNARAEGEGRLLYEQENRSSHARSTIALVREGDRIRVWSSVSADGHAYLADGKMGDDPSVESPWLNRCPAA